MSAVPLLIILFLTIVTLRYGERGAYRVGFLNGMVAGIVLALSIYCLVNY